MLGANLELILGGGTGLMLQDSNLWNIWVSGEQWARWSWCWSEKFECLTHQRALETYDPVLGKLPGFLEVAVILGKSC